MEVHGSRHNHEVTNFMYPIFTSYSKVGELYLNNISEQSKQMKHVQNIRKQRMKEISKAISQNTRLQLMHSEDHNMMSFDSQTIEIESEKANIVSEKDLVCNDPSRPYLIKINI